MKLIDAIRTAENAGKATDTELAEALAVTLEFSATIYTRRLRAEQSLRRESVNETVREKLGYDSPEPQGWDFVND